MKLLIQIPCFNEAATLPITLSDIPVRLDGVDEIQIIVIDDGSTDETYQIAKQSDKVNYVLRHRCNRGLAASFQSGMRAALLLGADIIVNTDADNQYCGKDIALLVAPIVNGDADIVIGDRQTDSIAEFSRCKRFLQRWGSTLVRRIGGVDVPDAVSGFRAISAEAAFGLNIVSSFSYTTEMLIHAGYRGLKVSSVPIRTNSKTRESRLYRSVPEFIFRSGATVVRAYTMYHPLRVFLSIAALMCLIGVVPILRFLAFYLWGDSTGHVQSLVLGGTCLLLGAISALMGICADVVACNRRLNEMILEQIVRSRAGDLLGCVEPASDKTHGSLAAGRKHRVDFVSPNAGPFERHE